MINFSIGAKNDPAEVAAMRTTLTPSPESWDAMTYAQRKAVWESQGLPGPDGVRLAPWTVR